MILKIQSYPQNLKLSSIVLANFCFQSEKVPLLSISSVYWNFWNFSKQGQKQFGSLVERQLYIAGQFYIVSITTQFIYRGAGEDIAGVG